MVAGPNVAAAARMAIASKVACLLACTAAMGCTTVLDLRLYPAHEKSSDTAEGEAARTIASMVEYPKRSADARGIIDDISGDWLTLADAKSRCGHRAACVGFTIALPGGVTDEAGKHTEKYDASTNTGETIFYAHIVDTAFAGQEAGYTMWVAPERLVTTFIERKNFNVANALDLVPGMPAGEMLSLDTAKLLCAKNSLCRGFNFCPSKDGYTEVNGLHHPDYVNPATGESKVFFFAPIEIRPLLGEFEKNVDTWLKPTQFM
jgi:hypothetical protein